MGEYSILKELLETDGLFSETTEKTWTQSEYIKACRE